MGSQNKRAKIVNEIPSPQWIDLPADITANILLRLGPIEMLQTAENVCTTWRKVCQDPVTWRVIHVRDDDDLDYEEYDLWRVAVDRSQGQLIEIKLDEIGDDGLLTYIVDRSIHLKRLALQGCCCELTGKGLVEAVKKLPHLEELHLAVMPSVEAKHIEAIGISCPTLTSFSFNELGYQPPEETYFSDNEVFVNRNHDSNKHAQAIAKTMSNLQHLSLVCNGMKNKGLEAILDGCPHLESLDLRLCFHLDLQGALGIRCYEQIKHVKGPFDSVSDVEWLDVDSDEIAFFGSPGYKERNVCTECDSSDEETPFYWYHNYNL